jgi:hypothetical protein
MKALALLAISLMIVSCKEEVDKSTLKQKIWTIKVSYLNNTSDTMEVVGYGKPYIRVSDGVSFLVTDDDYRRPLASYVKTIKIIKEDEVSR